MAQQMNVTLHSTAAQSPWSNGLNERHNAILADSVLKTMEDTGCRIETALAWALCAKNALANNKGFSPNQLVFGSNPCLPGILCNRLPALETATTSGIVAENLNAMHQARKAYIQA